MPTRIRSLSQISIARPCSADWEAMTGNDQVRFCEHCKLHVTNISRLNRRDAMRLVSESRGRLCVRFIQAAGGEILTRGSQRLHYVSRRVSRIAAGAFTAAVSIPSAAAQTTSSANLREVARTPVIEKPAVAASEGTRISGTVTDPNGAVVPGVTITLFNKETQLYFVYVTSEDGGYSFSQLSAGLYTIGVDAPTFAKTEAVEVKLTSGASREVDFTLKIPEVIAEVEVKLDATQVVTATMGVVVIVEPRTPFIKAAYKNDLGELVTLLPQTTDIDAADPDTHTTALAYAIEHNNQKMVNALLAAGAGVNRANETGRTPLMYLNDGTTVDFVRALISAGADVNAYDEHGGTALMTAAGSCKFEVLMELIAAGAKIDAKDQADNTVLMQAAINADTRIAKFLIDAGVRVDATNEDGESALTFAARSGQGATLKALIAVGAAINLAQSDLDAALLAGIENEDSSVVGILLAAGASAKAIDSEDMTALMLAAQSGKPAVVKALITAGADLNTVDGDGWTALMYADDVESVRVLLNAGADMTIKNKEGETALTLARESEQEEIVKLLRSRGAPE